MSTIVILFSLFSSFASDMPMLRAVPKLDLNQFSGDWYVIGSIPTETLEDCVCTRVRYGFKREDTLTVLTTCNERNPNGDLFHAKGVAKNFDKQKPGKLWVTYSWGFFWSPRQVIDLGSDYDFAVVSDARGRSLWVLSRRPEMSAEEYSEILMKLWAQGIDIDQIKLTRQDGCSYPK